MEKEPEMQNKTYEFIGRLALVLFSQNIKMSYATLIQLLVDNGLDNYGNEKGMASGIAAAYRRWEEIEKNNSSEGSDPSTWTRLETSPSVGGGVS